MSFHTTLAESLLFALLLGYLMGSIPFGFIFARLAGAGDVRQTGSGNIGATNVLRTGKRWAAAATLICDAVKGAAPILIARQFGLDAALVAGAGAFVGHVFPVWLGFRGGKGVAAFLGITFALDWRVGALVCAVWLVVAAVFRISSLSALVAATATPITFVFLSEVHLAMFTVMLTVLIFITHRTNIARLLRHKEPRIEFKRAPPA